MSRPVRKHRAPNGALRLDTYQTIKGADGQAVRKHQAPNGALRHSGAELGCFVDVIGQKAPSAKRCIKTQVRSATSIRAARSVRKYLAPKGALRLDADDVCQRDPLDC